MRKAGAREFFSFKMLWLIIATFLIFKGAKVLELYVCNNTDYDCSWVEKGVLLLAGIIWIFCVLKPLSIIFKLKK